jgi:nitrogen fixation protein FixH
MNRSILLSTLASACALILFGAPAIGAAAAPPAAAAQALAVTASVTPNPPKTGPATIVVTVSESGKPVKGAKVSIKTDMPAMAMAGPTLKATDNGDGTYSALTNLTDATAWRLQIQVKSGTKSGIAVVNLDVK